MNFYIVDLMQKQIALCKDRITHCQPNTCLLLLLSSGLLINASSWAATDTVYTMETIVLTATRSEQKLKDTPIRTEVVSSEELKKTNATTLKDALANVPGVLLREIHGKSGYEISLQGLSSDQVLVLIDGLPLAASTSSTVDLDQYLVAGVERVEVVKGAASAQYGSSAMGGVINIITKQVEEGISVSGQVDIGSYGKQNNNGKAASINNHHEKITIDASHGQFKGRISADQLSSDGFAVDPEQYPRQGDEQRRQQYALYGAWQPSDQLMLWADVNHYNEKDQQRSTVFKPPHYLPEHKVEDIERQRFSAGTKLTLWDKFKLDLKGLHETYQTTSVQTTDGYLSAQRTSEQENNHFSSQLNFPQWYRQNWQIGYDWHEDTLEQNNNGKFELQGGKVANTRHEVYAQNEINVRDDVDVVLGWRMQNDQDFGNHNAFKLSGKYRFYQQDDLLADLRLSFGQAYRVPNLKERFYSFDHSHLGYIVVGNPNLTPESSDSYQLGLSLIKDDLWSADVNFFYNDVQDLIQVDLDNAVIANGITQYSYRNISAAKTHGVESTLQWQPSVALGLSAAYTYTETQDKTSQNALTRRPKHIARVGVDYAFNDDLDLSLRARYQSEEYTDSANQFTSPSWFAVDGQLDYQINPLLSAFVGMDNIFNEQRNFDSAFDYRPIAGRYTYMGLRFNWSK